MRRIESNENAADESRPVDAAPELPSRERLRGIVEACHARLGRPFGAEDLDDVVQEVHVHAWRRLESFRGESSIDSWVFGIARLSILRKLSNSRRSSDREVPLVADEVDPVDPGTRPGSRFDTEFREVLAQGFGAGAEDAQEIFEAHELDGLPFNAIGKRLGLSETAVKSRYYRSLEALRSRLAPLWAGLRH